MWIAAWWVFEHALENIIATTIIVITMIIRRL
jgi:hypothetical protein